MAPSLTLRDEEKAVIAGNGERLGTVAAVTDEVVRLLEECLAVRWEVETSPWLWAVQPTMSRASG